MASTEPTEAVEQVVCPVKGCIIGVDLVLKSSDGKVIGAHQRNMDAYTEGFPCAEPGGVVSDAAEPVSLSEDAATLERLLHFCHKVDLPLLHDVGFNGMLALAETAEKHVAHVALCVCRAAMYPICTSDPTRAFAAWAYAMRYNVPLLAAHAASATLGCSLLKVTKAAGADADRMVMPWIRYREARLVVSTLPAPRSRRRSGLASMSAPIARRPTRESGTDSRSLTLP